MKTTLLSNPVTGFKVRLSPPLEYKDKHELEVFKAALGRHCIDAWDVEGKSLRNVMHADPRAIVDGTEPVQTLKPTIKQLIDEYGFWMVSAEIEKHRPQ